MNTRDGRRLTTSELAEMAIASGLITLEGLDRLTGDLHSEHAIASRLEQITDELRFAMFCRGELEFRTHRWVPSDRPPVALDAEIVAFVTRTT